MNFSKSKSIYVFLLSTILVGLTPAQVSPTALPVAHTYYDFSPSGLYTSFSIYLTWEDAPDTGYIYPALQFEFQQPRPAGGYTGIQLVNNTKKMIFSIWDNTENSGSAQPSPMTPWCGHFGGEGTGAQCLSEYSWIEGHEYYLHVRSIGTDPTGELWKSTITDMVTGQETIIGIIHIQNSSSYNGYGKITGGVTFVEYFAGGSNCDSQPYSRVFWRGPFAEYRSLTAQKATSYYNVCALLSSSGRPFVKQEIGGSIVTATPDGLSLWAFPLYLPMLKK